MTDRAKARYRWNHQLYLVDVEVDSNGLNPKIASDAIPQNPYNQQNGATGFERTANNTPKEDDSPKDKEQSDGCSSCGKKNKGRRGLKDLAKGAVGLAKSELGVGHAPPEIIELRSSVCRSCDRQDLGVCQECGCYCAAKVKLTKERCPLDKWGGE